MLDILPCDLQDGWSCITRKCFDISSPNFSLRCILAQNIFETFQFTYLSKCTFWHIRNLWLPFKSFHVGYVNILREFSVCIYHTEEYKGWHFAKQTTFSNTFLEWKLLHFDWNFTEVFFPEGPNNDKSALVQVVAWHLTCNKPLPEPMLTKISSATI